MATSIGNYRGLSTNFSGDGFSSMHFRVSVSSQKDFDSWVHVAQQSKIKLTEAEYEKLQQPSEDESVE